MKVLSLFDGMAGAALALTRLGVKDVVYHTSEINPFSQRVAQTHFSVIPLGDISQLNPADFSEREWDLVIFGSPCTDLSVAKKNRQSLAGKSSGLFYRAIEILRWAQPKRFLMENVASMTDESREEISSLLGVQPVEINSRFFTGQNRSRLYWFNWRTPDAPTTPVYFREKLLPFNEVCNLALSEAGKAYMDRHVKGGRTHWDFKHHSDTDEPHSACVVANFKKGVPYNVLLDRRPYAPYRPNTPDLWPFMRRFHPIECERLQGFPDDYSEGVAWTHRYEMVGNSFTVPVIEYLLKPIV